MNDMEKRLREIIHGPADYAMIKKYGKLESGKVTPLYYPDGEMRNVFMEKGNLMLSYDVPMKNPQGRLIGFAYCTEKIIAMSDNLEDLDE